MKTDALRDIIIKHIKQTRDHDLLDLIFKLLLAEGR